MESVELLGIDISSEIFPEKPPRNVRFYGMSATNLPTEKANSFNLIIQRMLLGAFTESQWRAALREILSVLKPGGAVQLLETGLYDSVYGSISISATREAVEPPIAVMDKRGLLGVECGNRLPAIHSEVEFSDARAEAHRVPVGEESGVS
ncbi:uncharacterized protein FOMMEDRAFT_30840 [Fomitiporia mediterranea MF3/22]|uniref:uncharacterized protein n=1 Tax=Fomitiporia mediterranea (strain MF3/22) TaxID=694068 RepID=UPI000440874B|nr:uncharacterized protein FOMMEDRAFT_30840 [Fomitiporia mediterranea MF3/22]EJD00186.1 hypothetical protein FOMMEDRAFT_30840 [Fomitiporia mediterranea MF3/22]